MSRFAVALLLICLHMGSVYGIDCSYGNDKNFIENLLTTCPRVTDPSDHTQCCYDPVNDKAYCCTIEEFALRTGFGVIFPVIIAVVIVITLIVCCISCLCCSCCPWYRRRQGTVYGKVHAPVVHVIQPQTNIPPSYTSQPIVPPYSMDSTGIPQPPPYTSEAYAKQAPYNPAYPPQ